MNKARRDRQKASRSRDIPYLGVVELDDVSLPDFDPDTERSAPGTGTLNEGIEHPADGVLRELNASAGLAGAHGAVNNETEG